MTIRLTTARPTAPAACLVASAARDALGAGHEFAHVAPDSGFRRALRRLAEAEWAREPSEDVIELR